MQNEIGGAGGWRASTVLTDETTTPGTRSLEAMEKCRMCRGEAAVVMIFDDNARIPYCNEHIPEDLQDPEALDSLVRLTGAVRGLAFSSGRAFTRQENH
jgi:hypothetical protein